MRFDKDEICRENVVFTKDVHRIGNVTVKNILKINNQISAIDPTSTTGKELTNIAGKIEFKNFQIFLFGLYSKISPINKIKESKKIQKIIKKFLDFDNYLFEINN